MAIGHIIGAAPMIVDVVGTLPVEEDVELGVQYGIGGIEFTGTFIPVYAGQDLIGTLEESVDLTGELES